VIDSDLRGLLAPVMAHCIFVAAATGILIPPIVLWFARYPYSHLLITMRNKAEKQPKDSNLRQLVALMPLLLWIGSPLVSLSFVFFLKWYYRVPVSKLNTQASVCMIVNCGAVLASYATTIWWLGGLQVFRPPGYDPKNPNPDPDEWRWRNRT
jgi:hypothetical protein